MSVCHIWLGVARSKKRGRTTLRRGLGGLSIISSLCSVRRTVSELALRKKTRLSSWEMRLIPRVGSSFFSSMILSRTGSGSLADLGPRVRSLRPSSP